MTATGADRLVETLVDLGVTVAFGLPGVHNLPIWAALGDSGVRLVGVRHEQTAVYAADGYARATGRLGVALVTTGPGAANTLGATGEALTSGSPVLIIATDIPSTLRHPGTYRGVLHECTDQKAMFLPVVRKAWNAETPDDIAPLARTAASRALSAPSGPTYLGIPTNFLRAPAGAPGSAGHAGGEEGGAPAQGGMQSEMQGRPQGGVQGAVQRGPQGGVQSGVMGSPAATPVSGPGPALASALRDDEREAAVELIASAERPLIWAGRGALRAGGQVAALAERIAAPVMTTYGGRGVVSPEHPYAVPGPVHAPEIGPLWDEADLVIGIGTDFDGMMTQNWAMPAPPKLVTVNVDPKDAGKNYPPDVLLTGDAATVLDALLSHVPERADRGVRDRIAALREEITEAVRADEPLAADLLEALRELPPETPIVCDMCIPGYWIGGYHPVPRPRTLAYPMGWGTLGFGFPASVGSAVARRTVCVTGDGGFLYGVGDLATAAQENLPLTIVLVDDGGYGMLRFDQVKSGLERRGVDLHTPDFAALARSFGIPATAVTGFGGDFTGALRESLRTEGPNLIVVAAAMKPPPTTSPRWYRGKGN